MRLYLKYVPERRLGKQKSDLCESLYSLVVNNTIARKLKATGAFPNVFDHTPTEPPYEIMEENVLNQNSKGRYFTKFC